jgi:catechol 2,3-dioxygenase-like lactoylglutathione lyase family enzyme
MDITSIYHININCMNFERSLAFYKMLGFKEVVDFGEGTGPQIRGLRIPGARGRAKLLRNQRREPFIDVGGETSS